MKVAREGVAVRARRGYFAPGRDDEGRRRRSRGGTPPSSARSTRRSTSPEVPLRAIADVLGEAEPGKAAVRLTVEADIRSLAFAEKGGTARDTLELLLLVAREDTGEFTRFDQQFEMSLRPETRARYERDGFPITRELPLAPGPLPGADRGPRPEQRARWAAYLTSSRSRTSPASACRASSSRDRLREEAKGGPRARADGPAAFAPAGNPALPLRGVRRGDGRRHRPAAA